VESEFTEGTIDKIVLRIKPESPQLNKQQQDSVSAEEVEREYLEE